MEYCYIHPKDDELMHYGVKGMHWGIRRYQPYSVNPRKNGANGKFIGKKAKKVKKDKNGLLVTPLVGPLAVYGAMLGAAVVASAVRAGKSKVNFNRAEKAKRAIDSNTNIDLKTGLKKLKNTESISESMKQINTEHNTNKESTKVNRTENCTSCSIALALRQKGYAVRAKELPEGTSNTRETIQKIFGSKPEFAKKQYDAKNAIIKKKGETWLDTNKLTEDQKLARNAAMYGANHNHAKDVKNWAKTQPDQFGYLGLKWGMGGGHSTNYQIINGKIMIHDPQANKTLTGSKADEWFAQSWASEFQRLDDKELKDPKLAKSLIYH